MEWEPAVVVVLRCCRRGVLPSLPSTTIATHHASLRRIARGGEELDATLLVCFAHSPVTVDGRRAAATAICSARRREVDALLCSCRDYP
nr:hypothetical protein Itr_chr12CG17060 [Ipomoea trifida]